MTEYDWKDLLERTCDECGADITIGERERGIKRCLGCRHAQRPTGVPGAVGVPHPDDR